MAIHDPLPNFNCMDPEPFPIPRQPVALWCRIVAWGTVGALILTLLACGFAYAGQALFAVLSSGALP